MDSIVTMAPADFTSPVVTLAMAKANANIQYTDQDDLLSVYLNAAIQDAEEYTGLTIQQRNVVMDFMGFEKFLSLPAVPVTEITSVIYVNEAGQPVTLAAGDDFDLIRAGHAILFKMAEFPKTQEGNPFPLTITAKVGYTDQTIPFFIRSAVLLKFGNKEMYREDAPVNGTDRSFNAALRPYKKW